MDMKGFIVKSILMILIVAGTSMSLFAQLKVTDGAVLTLDANSLLELESSDKGLLIPRMAINDVNLPSPLTAPVPTGMLVYSTGGAVSDGFYYWNGSLWTRFVTGTVQVSEGGTGLTSGTSGGIPAFTGTTTMSSSGVLNQDELVVGGGAGATPSSLGIGTANQVLAVNAAGTAYTHRAIRQLLGPWSENKLERNETDLQLLMGAGGVIQSNSGSRMMMPFDGVIRGIIVSGSEPNTAGTGTFTVFNNGTATAVTAVISTANPSYIATSNGNVSFSAGDILDLRVTTSADWDPRFSEYSGWIIIEWTN